MLPSAKILEMGAFCGYLRFSTSKDLFLWSRPGRTHLGRNNKAWFLVTGDLVGRNNDKVRYVHQCVKHLWAQFLIWKFEEQETAALHSR